MCMKYMKHCFYMKHVYIFELLGKYMWRLLQVIIAKWTSTNVKATLAWMMANVLMKWQDTYANVQKVTLVTTANIVSFRDLKKIKPEHMWYLISPFRVDEVRRIDH